MYMLRSMYLLRSVSRARLVGDSIVLMIAEGTEKYTGKGEGYAEKVNGRSDRGHGCRCAGEIWCEGGEREGERRVGHGSMKADYEKGCETVG